MAIVLPPVQEMSLPLTPDRKLFIEAMAVCNASEITNDGGHWKVLDEATAGALRTLLKSNI